VRRAATVPRRRGGRRYRAPALTEERRRLRRPFARIDRADGGSMSCVTAKGYIVIVIETVNADLVARAAAALP